MKSMNTQDRKNLNCERHKLKHQLEKLRFSKPITFILLLTIMTGATITYPALFQLYASVSIRSSGKIATIYPLHTEGRYIKNSLDNTVFLRGVWRGGFLDTSTGWYSYIVARWDEADVRRILAGIKSWGVNVVCFFIWGDWWLENKATTYGGSSTEIGCRDAVTRLVQIAGEYGLYIQMRLYAPTQTEGRREGFPFQPTYNWTVQDFVDFWVNVSSTLKDYPNVMYCLFDEPTAPSGYNHFDYFNACNQTITAMREITDQLIVIHWGYCGINCKWIVDWITHEYPTYNIVFSKHIYRYHGTFDNDPNSSVDIDYIKSKLNYTAPPIYYGYKYVIDTYNIPIWVSAIGAYNGATDDGEYTYFVNTLTVLNEWEIGYVANGVARNAESWSLLQNAMSQNFSEPNRVGQALINAIAGTLASPGS